MVPSAGRSTVRERSSAPDTVGVIVFGCCAGWALVSAAGREARPEGVLLALLAVAAGYACGRICGALLPAAAAGAAALAGALPAFTAPYDLPAAVVEPAPGHAAASAAQVALAAGAACCGAWAARSPAVRGGLRLMAAGIAVAALVLGSAAGCAAALAVLLLSLAAARMPRLPGLAGLALAAAVLAGGSWAMAEDLLPAGLAVSLEGQLTEHRVMLWRDAVGLAREHPVLGAGPDRFGDLSETVRQAVGSDGKPHSAPLQQAAEQGIPGVALLGAAFGWMLFALWRSSRPTPVVLTAAASLTALAALATIGNALSFVQVTVAAGVLAGLATARPLHEDALAGAVAAPVREPAR
jgi:hypothetical protein